MNTETKQAYDRQLHVAPVDKIYNMHLHYERERKFSLLLLVSGAILILNGMAGIFFMYDGSYRTGIASILVLAGMILGLRGFLINLKNQRRYNELASHLMITKESTSWLNSQEYRRTKKILLMLATEEIFLSLVFVTVLLILNLVNGVNFWTGLLEGTIPVVAVLLLGNTYRAFMYSNYRNKIGFEV
jgi:hypothetical protein